MQASRQRSAAERDAVVHARRLSPCRAARRRCRCSPARTSRPAFASTTATLRRRARPRHRARRWSASRFDSRRSRPLALELEPALERRRCVAPRRRRRCRRRRALDRWIRPWGRAVPPLLIASSSGHRPARIVRRVRSPVTLALPPSCPLATMLAALSGTRRLDASAPLLLLARVGATGPTPGAESDRPVAAGRRCRFLRWSWRWRSPQVGIFTWYSSGDDWWMFQRFAYRIFMQGYWLEGGRARSGFSRSIAGSSAACTSSLAIRASASCSGMRVRR